MFTTANQKTTKKQEIIFISIYSKQEKYRKKNKDVIRIYIINNQAFSSFYHHLLIS